MMRVSVCFTNFGPYHLARLRSLAHALKSHGGRLVAYEVAGTERTYPWSAPRTEEPFDWVTLFPDRVLETIPRGECRTAMNSALERDRPDVVGVVGYARPESMAALNWATRAERPAILLSESQRIDHPRLWWKEAIKRRRVRRFSAGLVGGPRHRAYLADLGLDGTRVALGYNAVDNDHFARRAEAERIAPDARRGSPAAPYFLAVNRFVPEKNLPRLVRAFARYRQEAQPAEAWDLVLCGDGPAAAEVREAIAASGVAKSIHCPGFLQADELPRWYAFAGAFVHPSLMEPWGLVVNEAAACGLPLLVSERAGCAETLVPDEGRPSGRRFDPSDEDVLAASLTWMASLSGAERSQLGARAAEVVADWGPERFAQGMLEALEMAVRAQPSRRRYEASGRN
ncbi:MAG: glycosyltransferase family 4 protein [Isosphaeraceae bacterium]|nr:glycosyltransferase family 4 protein [Isosphaeraceae bacterium]